MQGHIKFHVWLVKLQVTARLKLPPGELTPTRSQGTWACSCTNSIGDPQGLTLKFPGDDLCGSFRSDQMLALKSCSIHFWGIFRDFGKLVCQLAFTSNAFLRHWQASVTFGALARWCIRLNNLHFAIILIIISRFSFCCSLVWKSSTQQYLPQPLS